MSGGEKVGEINQFSYSHRDLLQSFNFSGEKKTFEENKEVEEEEEGLELSLGLSLNGRFGVDPKRGNSIIRASSISNFPIDSAGKSSSLYGGALGRTCSLPVETEEWRKRKELQSLKRLEAKRKRMEKMKNVRVVREKQLNNNNNNKVIVGPPPPPPPPLIAKGNSVQFSSQGSTGSQASSGVSDLESQEIRGTNKTPEEGSLASGRSSVEQQIADKPTEVAVKNPSPKAAHVGLEGKESNKSMIGDMPCVSTRGDGPDGRRINGFLYRYGKGEELKIICVCHGSFLSPAEFVKHGGGGDVENPLKHIVINPSLM